MGISKAFGFVGRDVYIDYPYMKIMFRWEYETERIFARAYGKDEHPQPIAHHNDVFTQASLFGAEISRDEYLSGK